jgi:putative oxidoreductase
MDFLKGWSEPIYAATRIVVGFLFLCHGLQKLYGIATGAEVPMPAPLLWSAALIEAGGGLLVMLGWFTSIAGFLASGTMAVAYFMAHNSFATAPEGLLPLFNKGELAALYAFVFLMFAAKGPGIWSVDAAQGRS